LAGVAGTHVKRDFVEMPSQMLEEWLYDNAILKKVSHHYKTGEPLPDDIIESVIKLKNFSTGIDLQRQGLLANLSLAYFKAGADKDPHGILKGLFEQLIYGVQFDPEYHFYASFGHLTGYGPSYYGYLWSKVFALDLFDTIKQHGLLNGQIGQKYIDAVLSKGGSKDPNDLLVDFLGRQPNDTAFLRDLGLN
jgi:thimet oligopeptidase